MHENMYIQAISRIYFLIHIAETLLLLDFGCEFFSDDSKEDYKSLRHTLIILFKRINLSDEIPF